MVAYNLMSLFRHFGLNSHNQATLATLRSYCFAIGGWISQHARKRVLKLSLPRQKRPWMDAIFQQIEARPPPDAYPTAYSAGLCWPVGPQSTFVGPLEPFVKRNLSEPTSDHMPPRS